MGHRDRLENSWGHLGCDSEVQAEQMKVGSESPDSSRPGSWRHVALGEEQTDGDPAVKPRQGVSWETGPVLVALSD